MSRKPRSAPPVTPTPAMAVLGAVELLAILDAIPLPLLVSDPAGNAILANAELLHEAAVAGANAADPAGAGFFPLHAEAAPSGDAADGAPAQDVVRQDHLRWHPRLAQARLIRSFERRIPAAEGAGHTRITAFVDITAEQAQIRERQQAEQRLAGIIESALDGIITCDGEGRVLIFNAAAEAMFGLSRSEVIGRNLEQLLPPRFRGRHAAWMREFGDGPAQHRRMSAPGNVYALRADGSEFPVEASISHARVDGELLLSVVLRDISERVSQQQALELSRQELKQTEQRLAGIIESALDGIITCNEEGKVLIFNAAAEAMFGVPRALMIGQNLERLLPPRFRARHSDWMREFSAGPSSHRRMSAPGNVFALRADGSEFPVEASISHVQVDGERLLSVVLRDTSERAAQQRALEFSRNALSNMTRRLELAVIGSGFGVWEFDIDTGQLIWDAQMHRIYGFAPGSFDGDPTNWSGCIHPEDREAVDLRFNSLLKGEPVELFLFRILRRDTGALRYIEANGYVETGVDGRLTRLVGMNRDATETVKSEQALRRMNLELEQRVAERTAELARAKEIADEASRAKSEFLANMSHELRTPLHSILGFVKLAIEDDDALPRAQRLRYLERIRHSGEVLLELVNDLLDSAKIEARKLILNPAPFDLAQALDQVIEEFHAGFAAKALVLEGARVRPLRMVGDAVRIGQAVRNVLANAVRFAPQGSAILVDLFAVDDRVELCIGDRGPGIPEAELEVIFETFAQSSLTGDGGGTGLGLPITRGIVELHRGAIRAQNRDGGGALFTLVLPRSGPL